MPVKPVWVVIILVFFAAWLGGSAWFGNQWRSLEAPDLLERDAVGNVYVSVYNQILGFDTEGHYQRTFDLAAIGIKQVSTGGFGVFSNGDLLLLKGEPELSAVEELLRFLRLDNSNTDQGDAKAPVLQRCNLVAAICKPLLGFARQFKHTFRIYIDGKDNIFLADTAGHAVYWLDADGHEIDALKTGFEYPNDIRRIGDTLWIANTNYHQLKSIGLSSGKFGKQNSIPILNDNTRSRGETWPSEFEWFNGQFWVLAQNNNMAHGGVHRFDAEGKYLGRVDTRERDAISITQTASEIWVADFRNLVINRYNAQGNFIGTVDDPHLEALLKQPRERIGLLYMLDRICWYGFWVFLVLGMIAAVILDRRYRKQCPEKFTPAPDVTSVVDDGRAKPDPDSPLINWIGLSASQKRLMWLMIVMMCVLALDILYLDHSIAVHHPDKGGLLPPAMLYGTVIASVIAAIFFYRMMQMSVAAYGPWLLVKNFSGKIGIAKGSDIKVVNNRVFVEGVILNYRNNRGALAFDKDRFEKEIQPLLESGEKWSELDMMKWQWKNQRTKALLTWSGMVLLIILVIVMQLTRHHH